MPTFVVILLAINTLVLIGLFAMAGVLWLAFRDADETRAEMKRADAIRREVGERIARVR